MLSAILTAIGLLLNTLNGLNSSDRKRQRLAKSLYEIYEDLTGIVERGRDLLSYAEALDKLTVNDIPIKLLRSQQAALISFNEHFGRVAHILELHLPSETGRLQVITEFKSTRVALLLNFPVDKTPMRVTTNAPVVAITPATQKLLDDYVQMGLQWYPGAQIELHDKTWNTDFDLAAVLVASPSDVQAAYRVLEEITKVREDLRKFLVEKFEVQDLS